MARPTKSIRPQGRIGGGGQGLVEEGVDLVVVLAEDLAVVGIGGHPLETVDEDFDGGTDVVVLVQGEDAVLLALLYQIGGRYPGGGTGNFLGLLGFVTKKKCLQFLKKPPSSAAPTPEAFSYRDWPFPSSRNIS
jgi:hypothetical protein